MSPRLAFRRCLALKKLATCVNHPPTNVYPWTLPWIVIFDHSTGANSEEAWQRCHPTVRLFSDLEVDPSGEPSSSIRVAGWRSGKFVMCLSLLMGDLIRKAPRWPSNRIGVDVQERHIFQISNIGISILSIGGWWSISIAMWGLPKSSLCNFIGIICGMVR